MIAHKKISSRLYQIARATLAAIAIPVFLIYILIDKPDYKIINAAGHIIIPVATAIGDVVTWPLRLVGKAAYGIRELSTIRTENEELRVRLDAALADKVQCDIAITENRALAKKLEIVNTRPGRVIIANIRFDNSVIANHTFFINRGENDGIAPNMAVVRMDNSLAGIVIDVGANFARIRAVTDSRSNIPVRILASDVYGFLTGTGDSTPILQFLSDPNFQITPGLKLVTSNIGGILPDGIMVGETANGNSVNVPNPVQSVGVMVLGNQ